MQALFAVVASAARRQHTVRLLIASSMCERLSETLTVTRCVAPVSRTVRGCVHGDPAGALYSQ